MSVPLLLCLMIYICKYDCMQSYSYVGGEVKTYRLANFVRFWVSAKIF